MNDSDIHENKCCYKIYTIILILNYVMLSVLSIVYLYAYSNESGCKKSSVLTNKYIVKQIYINLAVYSSLPTIAIVLWLFVWQIYSLIKWWGRCCEENDQKDNIVSF